MHPIFSKFDCFSGDVEAGYAADFLGVKTKGLYYSDNHINSRAIISKYPPFDEEYYEWVDTLESVCLAKNSYVMIELGAGWGRWLSRAFAALRRIYPDMPCTVIGVEAEPTHFKWMQEHCRYNNIDCATLINAAVNDEDGDVGFHFGKPSEWYGQCIGGDNTVKGISLKSILVGMEHVDLMDLDVQNFEAKILKSAKDYLFIVKRIHIGTHSVEVEQELKDLFNGLGWECVRDYTLMATHETEHGVAEFNDGVQTWINHK